MTEEMRSLCGWSVRTTSSIPTNRQLADQNIFTESTRPRAPVLAAQCRLQVGNPSGVEQPDFGSRSEDIGLCNIRQLARQIVRIEPPLLSPWCDHSVRAAIGFREALQRWEHLDDTVVAGVVAKQKPTLIISE